MQEGWSEFTKQAIKKSNTVLMDPDMIKLLVGLMQWPGVSGSQNFRIGWLMSQLVLDEESRGRHIPLNDDERCERYGIRKNKGGDGEQDDFQFCNWKYPTIECQSR